MTGPGWLRMFVESAGRPERRFQAEHAQSEAGGVFSAPVSCVYPGLPLSSISPPMHERPHRAGLCRPRRIAPEGGRLNPGTPSCSEQLVTDHINRSGPAQWTTGAQVKPHSQGLPQSERNSLTVMGCPVLHYNHRPSAIGHRASGPNQPCPGSTRSSLLSPHPGVLSGLFS